MCAHSPSLVHGLHTVQGLLLPCALPCLIIAHNSVVGRPHTQLYLVETGLFEASRYNYYTTIYSERDRTTLRMYGDGTCFGERALMQNVPRAASVTCIESGRLWALDRLTFRKLVHGGDLAQPSTEHRASETEDDEPHDDDLRDDTTHDGLRTEPKVLKNDGPDGLQDEAASSAKVAVFQGGASSKRLTPLPAVNPLPATNTLAATADTDDAPPPGDGAPLKAPTGRGRALWQKVRGIRMLRVSFESAEERQLRKAIRRSPALLQLLTGMWEVAEASQMRMHRESYLNYHLSLTRALLEMYGDVDDFDAMDAFDGALEDWERDTDHGALPSLHADAFVDSLFEVGMPIVLACSVSLELAHICSGTHAHVHAHAATLGHKHAVETSCGAHLWRCKL